MVTRIQRQNILELDKLENWAKWRHGLIAVLFSRPAGLRRSFRLSRKEKENGVNEGKPAEQADPAEFLTYEEVTQYQQQPGDQQRLVVLIGRSTIGSNLFTINHQKKPPPNSSNPFLIFLLPFPLFFHLNTHVLTLSKPPMKRCGVELSSNILHAVLIPCA